MNKSPIPFQVNFTAFQGFLFRKLLQSGPVRCHRIRRGCVENPAEYKIFIAEVIARRIMDTNCTRLGIFGTGEHTRILLTAIPWLIERVRCFADNNAMLHGQEFMNRPVRPPCDAVKECDAFLLSTTLFQRSMHKDLKQLGFNGPMISMDDDVPSHWFLIQEDYDPI